jgi:hypothetical protein
MDPILAMLIYLAGFALSVFMLLAVFRLFRISADLSRIRQLLEYQAEQKGSVQPASPAPAQSDPRFDRRADRIVVGLGASAVIIAVIVIVFRALQ